MIDQNKNPIVSCKNLTLGYGRDIILENVSLEIPQGIFLPFIGPNGAGKTTLLRGILGLIKPMKGTVHTPFQTTPAGYVPQHKSIDPLFPLTVWEIIAMGFYPQLGWWKNSSSEDKKILEDTMEELKLTEHAHKNYRDLSGGTRQKTLVARAFVSGADVFIMDEPTSELDETSEREVFHHLSDFVLKHHKTVLMAHHGLNQLISSSTSSEVCIVNHGKVKMMKINELKASAGVF